MHIYFSGIGGVGIGPLALLALDAGYEVSGSDQQASELTELLEKRGVKVQVGQSDQKIAAMHAKSPIDWLVYSSALPSDHPELQFAQKNKLKMSKRAEFLNHLLAEKDLQLVAVAGTHGKTTTTGMLIWLFKQLGLPVSYSVGTSLSFGPPAQYEPGSKYFVYECDEFDKNFLDFHPQLSVITSLDYDHPDTYPTKADYLKAFSSFTNQSALTIAWESDADTLKSEAHLFVVPDNRDFSAVTLAGQHNRRNAWLAATAVNRLAIVENSTEAWEDLLAKINTFPGTNRRFERLANNLYSDYAHHPTEIAATVEAAKEMLEPDQKLVVVYQPHQNIRQHELLQAGGYKDCFEGVDQLYWLPTYLSREYQKLPIASPQALLDSATISGKAKIVALDDQLKQTLETHQQNGDLVVGMSAGDLDHWLRENVA